MKNIVTYTLVLLLLSAAGMESYAQNLESKGKISNMGQIIVNGMLVSSGSGNSGKAEIDNQGRIEVGGNAVIEQDTIDGEVHYTKNDITQIQIIPQITYSTVKFSGISKKHLDKPIPLAARDTFLTTNNNVEIKMPGDATIITNGRVEHQGLINPATTKGRLILYGESAQNIDGKGVFKELELDNSAGADVINGGGFRVNSMLELKRGEFRNSADNNFKMDDSSLIVRHVGASLAHDPEFDNTVSVAYAGSGTITGGPEIPDDPGILQELTVNNSGGLYLEKNTVVNRNIYVGSSIYTEPDSNNKNELVLTSTNTPTFGGPDSEIDGTFRRTNLLTDGSEIVFNNPYTYLKFDDIASAAGAREIAMRVKPRRFHDYPNGDDKVRRTFELYAFDSTGNLIQFGGNYEFGYGWRNTADDRNETNDLTISELKLQRWANTEWADIQSSKTPQLDNNAGWAFSNATEVSSFGAFAIGLPSNFQLVFRAFALLEGPYRYGSMQDDLRERGMIPNVPPDVYPYNLDPNRQFTVVDPIPDSVVDWVVLEFRQSMQSEERQYRTAFIRTDGRIVDLDGKSPVIVSKSDISSGDYYVALRHRNHLAVITENPVAVYPETIDEVVDFSNPEILFGRRNAVKPVGYEQDGKTLYGLIGGDHNQDGIIDDADLIMSYDNRELEGPGGFDTFLRYNSDGNMNGINNTTDFNVSWNNRGKRSFEK